MILLLLRKSVKSIQSVVNELLILLGLESVSGAAFSQARARIRHTAFIELNEKAVVEVMYRDGRYSRYQQFRLLAVDGSKIRLPETVEINEVFGQITYTNGRNDESEGRHTYAQGSVLYDVLNHLAIDARLGQATDYEVDLAVQHLEKTQEGDLIIADRGYASYYFLAHLHQAGRDFVVRCSSGSFSAARAMFSGQGPASQQVTLVAPHTRKELKSSGLPKRLKVRLVRILLDTGEYEVLVTSLLDEARYPTADFKEIYGLRWGVEDFYGVIKTRLQLENFTGKTVESIRQDFHATIYMTGLESILTNDAEEQLSQRNTRHEYHVNQVVSFNVIKNEVIDLLDRESDVDVLLKKLTRLFLKNPSCIRKNRKVPRRKSSNRKLLNYHKRLKKICF